MKKIDWKTCIRIAITVFVVYLAIHYWPHAANLIKTLIAAALPLFVGAVLAYPINILVSFYENKFFKNAKNKVLLKSRRGISILLSIVTLLAIIAFIIALVVPQVTSCVKLVIDKLPGFFNLVVEKISEFDFVPEDIIATLSAIDWKSKITDIIKTVGSGIGSVMDVVITTVSSVVSGVTTSVLAFIFAMYVLSSKEKLGAQFKKIMNRYVPEKVIDKITYVTSVADESFHKFIVAQCTEALILGVLCTAGMLILRLPYAIMIGAVTAVSAFIPVVGAFIGGGIGAFLIFMESPVKALIFLVFIVLLQQIEGDLIYPKIVGSSIGLPSIWVLAAVTVGGGVFGVLGMLLGVPVASTVYKLIRNDVNRQSTIRETVTNEETIAVEKEPQGNS